MTHDRPVPAGLHVMHACDNPQCVRPDHLSAGTRSDNMQDAVRKGRHVHFVGRGEQCPASKLTEAQAAEIKRRLAAGESRRLLAQEFGLTKAAVKFIATGRTWGWLEVGR
jgi:hypothetical protein